MGFCFIEHNEGGRVFALDVVGNVYESFAILGGGRKSSLHQGVGGGALSVSFDILGWRKPPLCQ